MRGRSIWGRWRRGDRSGEADGSLSAEQRHQRALLVEQARSGSPSAATRLILGFQRLNEDQPVLDAIESFVTSSDARTLLELSRRIRASAGWGSSGWYGLRPADLPGFERLWPVSSTGAVIASMSRNGYLREAAVRSLSVTPEGPALGALVIRTADWVEPVRRVAASAVSAELDVAPQRLVSWLPMLDVSGALRDSPTGRLLESTFRSTQLAPAVSIGLMSTDLRVRQACGRRISTLDLPKTQRGEALKRALAQDDPATAAFVALPVLDSAEATEEELRLAAKSRHGSVRARAVWASRRTGACDDLAPAALSDASAVVRDAAQQVIRERGGDPAAEYRSRLLDGDSSVAVVAGLGETGEASDTKALRPFLVDSRARTRVAAVTGIGRLDGDACVDDLINALGDGSSRVARAAAAALRPAIGSLDRDRLWAALRSAPMTSARWTLWLLSQPSGWVELETCLRVLAEGPHQLDERAVDRVTAVVDGWASLSRRPPLAPSRARIMDLFPAAQSRLGKPLSERLDAVLRSWSR
ncbi:MAG: hypothetical protein ACK5O2_14805 [Microthrixaceae bacterium]